MDRFAKMMLQNLALAGVPAEIMVPRPFFGNLFGSSSAIGKWLAYIDKFVVFPWQLRAKLHQQAAIVHICDHSNAMYDAHTGSNRVVVTCHDLIAVRQALGEELHCPVSVTGRFLQRWILRGLRRADVVACVSRATCADAERLIARNGSSPALEVVSLGLSYPYRQLSSAESGERLKQIPRLNGPFALHVGSNLPRKNRAGVLRIFARCKDKWAGQIVFAGDPLSPELTDLAQRLGVSGRIVEVSNASEQTLEALYSSATAMIFPSYSEGFGWPIIEAHSCGCPVICSTVAPLPDTAGAAGLFHDPEDENGFAGDLLRLTDSEQRALWSEKSLQNARRFSVSDMTSRYIDIYRSLGAQV